METIVIRVSGPALPASYPSTPTPFGVIDALIGDLKQGFGRVTICRKICNSRAESNSQRRIAWHGATCKFVQQMLYEGRPPGFIDALEKQHELIAAVTEKQVGGTQPGHHAPDKFSQDLVSARMPVRIVDFLEMIQIQKDERKIITIHLGPLDLFWQADIKGLPGQ